jgi:L-threonylcarbamoyladenylate synthase
MSFNFLYELQFIKEKLLNDKVILFPTDTVYGLLANAYSEKAKENVFLIKERSREKTFALFIDKKKIDNYLDLNERNYLLFQRFTPGPVTFIVKNKDIKLNHIAFNNKIGVRIPENKFLQKLLEILDFPLIATSANISNEETPINYRDVNNKIKNHHLVHNLNYEYLLDLKPSGFSSSIFDISEDEIKVLRDGKIKLGDLII